MVFQKNNKINSGRKRIDVTLRNIIDNPIKKIKHPFLGKQHTKETKIKMRQNHWSKNGFVHPMLGKHHSEETKKIKSINMIGNKNPNWINGKSMEPYTKEFNKKFKCLIKERDGCCMLCNVSLEDLRLLKRQVNVHHIDYNKLNSFPQNCVTLCNLCHNKTNFNRTQWILFFQSLLKERYKYEYSEDQKIIFDFQVLKGGMTKYD